MSDSLIHDVRTVLLNHASNQANQSWFDSLVDSITKVSNCTLCSLWSINNNSTQEEVEPKYVFQSISIIARKLKDGLDSYPYNDFVLELKGTFIEKTIKDNNMYYIGGCRREYRQKLSTRSQCPVHSRVI